MKVIFRVDASPSIGYGHLIRSLSLAGELESRGDSEISFIINNFEPAKAKVIAKGFPCQVLPDDANEEAYVLAHLYSFPDSIVIFDNLKDYSKTFIQSVEVRHKVVMIHSYSESRFHASLAIYPAAHLPCEFLSDQQWKTSRVKMVSGFEYVLLNQNILSLKRQNPNKKSIDTIVFLAGGSDPSKSLFRLFGWSAKYYSNAGLHLKFMYGQACGYEKDISLLPPIDNFEWLPFNEACLENADIAVCAFGVTTYELIYLNIPTISYGHTLAHANASKRLAEKYQCIIDIGLVQEFKDEELFHLVNEVIDSEETRNRLHSICENLIDGEGVKRVANEIRKLVSNEDIN